MGVRISFCGDIKLLHPSGLSFSTNLKNIIQDCDFNVINFEAPIAVDGQNGVEKSGPCISQSHESPSWIEDNGWNVISLANNHTMDYGTDGLVNTMNAFNNAYLIGAGTWDNAYKPLILESNGWTIGIIACSHREFGCLHDEYSQCGGMGVAWICHPIIEKLISETKRNVDALFIYAHAGVEELEQPLPEWRTLYKHFIDMGCDGVIASHPHIQMGHETYKGKPIYYSLGNFCFQKDDYSELKESWFKSIMVELIVNDDRSISVKDHLLIYDPLANEIKFDNSEASLHHVEDMNRCLHNQEEYIVFINQKAIEMLPWYYQLFSWSGLVHIPLIPETRFRTRVKNYLLRRKPKREDKTTKAHLLNNLQCESHRWIIQRAINIMYNIN